MAAWTPITAALIAIGKGVKATTHLAIFDNITALAEGASGAPSIEEAAMAAASVNQSALKTSISGAVSTGTTRASLTLPGGTYGFYPQIRMNDTTARRWFAMNVSQNIAAAVYTATTQAGWTGYTSEIQMGEDGVGTIFAQQRYITASPPYDLGDGEVPLFVFACIDDGTGMVESAYVAADPPWAYNGPTEIGATHWSSGYGSIPMQKRRRRPPTALDRMTPAQSEAWMAQVAANPFEEVEVNQALKQADMPVIPHPFMNNDLTDKSIVLIDPVSDFCADLAERQAHGQDINALLHSGRIVIDNKDVARATPPGVLAHPARLKLTP